MTEEHSMIVGFLKEAGEEHRVAMTPEVIQKWPGVEFCLEAGAGLKAGFPDHLYESVGAKIENGPKAVIEKAHLILSLGLSSDDSLPYFRKGTILLGLLRPAQNSAKLAALSQKGVSCFAIEQLPRTTRAQSMDTLSSQSNLAGYQAAVYAAAHLGRSFPLMMTAAGSLPAVRVLVIGAGVAGLQAIATARRLGAIVSAFDVRAAAKEQVESLGATFVDVAINESGEGGGGYAKEMSASYQAAQEAKLAEVLPLQDVVITTAQIPNKPAPKILTRRLVDTMKNGVFVLDLAAESGGNCEYSKPGQEVVIDGKRIFAPLRFLNQVAATASRLLAANMKAFTQTLLTFKDGAISFNASDDLIRSTLYTRES